MRPDQPRGTARAETAREIAKPRNADALRARRRRLALEALEARTLLTVLPAPSVLTQTDVSGTTGSSDASSPVIAVDPTNPLNVAAVWQVHDPALGPTPDQVEGATSDDGGMTWTPFEATPFIGTDPSSGSGAPFGAVTDGSVAWDRSGNIYVAEAEHQNLASNTTGELIVLKYAVSQGMANLTSGTVVTSWWQGQAGRNQTEVFNPTLAVDNNLASFTDPDTGATVTDPGAGDVYITDTEENPPPAGNTADWNPLTTELWTSTDGGTSFPTNLNAFTFGNQIGLGPTGAQREADPKIAISQGTSDGKVAGGTVTLVWDDFGVFSGAGPVPLDAIVDQQVAAGGSEILTGPNLVQTTIVRDDPGSNYGSGSPTAPPRTHSVATLADPFGIAPAPSIASDNTLGSFSPNQGRIYVTYTDRYDPRRVDDLVVGQAAAGNPADNTDIFITSLDPETGLWSAPVQVNDDVDSATDGYSDSFVNTLTGPITGRPQFQSQVAVDPTTGTVAVSFLDARYDAARARVATTLTTSIDGGNTFSPQNMAFADAPNAAFDEITRATDVLGPIPENQSSGNPLTDSANFSYGDHQGLAFEDGHLYPAFSGNFNGGITGTQRLDIIVSPSTTAAGPRVVSATMGAVGEPGDRINVDKNPDGSPIADSFQVTFDRPVDPSTFNTLPTQAFAGIFSANFDDGTTDGFTINNTPNSDPNYTAGLWHLSTGRGDDPGHSPTDSLYYGSGETSTGGGNYVGVPGTANAGTATSPAIVLPADKFLELTFNYFLQTEGDAPEFDYADVKVIDLTHPAKTAIVDDNSVGTGKLIDSGTGFHSATVDLSAFAGDRVEVQFGFDTRDSLNNDFEGWYVDDVAVFQPALTADVTIQARDALGNLLPIQPVVSGVTPLDDGTFGATTFLVHFAFPIDPSTGKTYVPPETATYSYSVGPDISDRIRTVAADGSTINGNEMDQNDDGIAGEDTQQAGKNDAFSDPQALNDVPFVLPYSTTTLPLITPGPHVASAIVYDADGTDPSSTTQPPALAAPVPIPAATVGANNVVTNGMATSTLTIGGDTDLQVTKLAVTISISIPDTTDLIVTLVGPDNTKVDLSEAEPQPPASGADFDDTEFTDSSDTPIAAGLPSYDGVFKPDQALSAFNGHLVAGTWTLQVENTSTGDVGSILGWTLQVSSEAVALDHPLSSVPIVFDRNMDPTTLTPSSVLAVMGPDGQVIPGPYSIVPMPDLDPDHPDPDPAHPRTYLVEFSPQSASGSFSIILASSIKSEAGDPIDSNLNAGVTALRGDPTGTNVAVQYTSPGSTPIGPGVSDSSITIPATDDYAIQAGVKLQLDITYANDPDLTATLITPGGARIILFSGVGAAGSHSNFTNTIFSDTAPTPIQQGGPPFASVTGFQPQEPLDVLVGQVAAGTYTLEISDSSGSRTGTLNYWNLTFNKTVPTTGLGEPVSDQTTIPFRVFNLDPTSAASSESWTAVGPAGIASAEGAGTNGQTAGRVNAIAVDPSDPSGNTVYAGGASGGVWKTTDFLTTSPEGPTWTPLTDFGPAFAANIGSIAIFPRNGDPNQSVIFAATGEGDALGDPTQASAAVGVGVLRSMDGGRTWTLLDSTNNNLPFSSTDPAVQTRDHVFAKGQGTASFRIIVDPKPTVSGGIVVLMAISGVDGAEGTGGIWRSLDSGQTWTQVLKGQATDVVADLDSATGVSGGNLQTYYAAIEGLGVYQSTSQGSLGTWHLLTGGVGDPQIQEGNQPSQPVPVAAPLGTPNGPKGRIVLAKPALTGNALIDSQYQGWLYAAVVAAPGDDVFSTQEQFDGLYMTKDGGQNWVKVTIPTDGGLPTNDTTEPNYTLTGSKTPAGTSLGLGNFDIALTVDPNDPNVVYLGGTDEFQTSGLLRIDVTAIDDAHAFYSSQDLPDNGTRSAYSQGALSESNPPQMPAPFVPPYYPNILAGTPTLNLLRDPSQPFLTNGTVRVANAGKFSNTGADVKWIPFDQALAPDPFDPDGADAQAQPTKGQHQIVAIQDPTTGGTRLIFADDQGVYSVVTNSDGTLIGSLGGLDTSIPGALATDQGDTVIPSGSRNGNLQIAQLYSAAAQPSNSAANQAVLPGFFYGNTSENGQPQSDPNEVNNAANGTSASAGAGYGDLSWSGDTASVGNPTPDYAQGSGAGVGVDQTGSGSVYQYKWPISLVEQDLPPTYFLQYNGQNRTNGLVLSSNGGDVPDPEWPYRTGSNFAVNPIDGQQVVISSQTGQIFRTENSGGVWNVIGQPSALDGSYAPALAFGAPMTQGVGNLDDFIYAGTTDGNIFVTTTGGAGGGGNSWINTTPLPASGYFSNPAVSGSIDYSPVEQIVTDPTRGKDDAYAVTAGGTTFSAPNFTPLSMDGNTTENVINSMHTGHEEVYIDKDVDVSSLTVTVNVGFSNDSHLTLTLVAPDGTVYPLVTDNPGGGQNYTNTIFDDQSTNNIYGAAAPYTGTFTPAASANGPDTVFSNRYKVGLSSNFFGKDIRGTWTLVASTDDPAMMSTGAINSWSLNYTTLGGVYYNPHATSGGTWENISGDLYLFTAPSFDDPSESDTVARSLTSIVADWRYALPDASGATHPILYVGGDSGVFQSIDDGQTWTKFPASGGGLPEVDVTGLQLVTGDIDPTTGRPDAQPSDPDLLTASTYGRGEFAINLTPVILASTLSLDPTAPTTDPSGVFGLDATRTAASEGPNGVGSDTGSSATDNLTADTHPYITGYSQETAFGSTVTVDVFDETPGTPDFGKQVGTGTTLGSGRFSVQVTGNIVPTSPSQNGDLITLDLAAVANSGTAYAAVGAAEQFQFTLDSVKPAKPPKPALQASSDSGQSQTDGITDVNDPIFNVSNVEPGAELQLFRSGVLVATIFDVGPVGGTVPIQDPGPALDGTYTYTVRQVDVAGNVGPLSDGTQVTIITVKPGMLSAPDLEAASDSGYSNTDNYTNDTAPTFDVSGVDPHYELELLRNGVVVNTIIDVGAAGGTVAISDPGPVQPDGTYTYTAIQLDVAGNMSPTSNGLAVTIDTMKPAPPTGLALDPGSDSGVKGDGITNSTMPVFDIASGVESKATVYLQRAVQSATPTFVTVAQVGPPTSAGGLTIQDPSVPNGYYLYRVYQVDQAGNVGNPTAAIPIRILSGTPVTPGPITLDSTTDSGYGPPNDPTRSDDTTSATIVRFPRIDVAGIIPGSTVSLFRNGILVNSVVSASGGTVQISDPRQPFADGIYDYTAQQVDAAGDSSAIGGPLAVTFDNTPPATPSVPRLEPGSDSGTIGDGVTNDRSPIFDVSNVEANAEVELLRDGTVVGTVLHAVGGTVAIQDPSAPPGIHSYSAVQVDEAGNTSGLGGSVQITILTTGPTIAPSTPVLIASSDSGASQTDDVTNVTSPVFNIATAQAGVTVQLIRYTAGVGVVVASRVGPGTIQDPGPLGPGYYGYAAQEVDSAGNAGPSSGTLVILVVNASAPPSAPTLDPASDSGVPGDNITDINRPTFDVSPSGPAAIAPAATISLFRNGVLVGTRQGAGPITDNGPGGAGVGDGTYVYTAIQTDLAGNVSTASTGTTVTIVTSIAAPGTPILSSPPGGNYTSVTHPVLTIPTAPAGSTVSLFRNNLYVGSRVGAGPITDNGPTGSGLPPGTYVYTAYAQDAAGNTSAASGALAVTIATALAAPPAPALAPSSDSGTVGDGITNVSSPLISVTAASPQATVVLLRKPAGAPDSAYAIVGSRVGSGTIQDAGAGSGLADGSYTYAAFQGDPAGNASGLSPASTITIRTAPPVATAAPTLDPASDSSPGHGGTSTDVTSPIFDVTGSTPGSPVGVAVVLYRKPAGSSDSAYVAVAGAVAAAGTVRLQDPGPLAQGSYTYATRQIDVAGNVGPLSPPKTINILTVRPGTPTLQISPATDTGTVGDGITSDRSPVFVGVGEPGTTIVLINASTGGLVGVGPTSAVNGSYSIAAGPFQDQTIPLQAIDVDPAGNTSRIPGSLNVRIVTVAGDYTGDGKADLASFTPGATGAFNLAPTTSGVASIPFGQAGDIPISGDFDGDGKADIGVYRPSTGQWIIQRSTLGLETINFGNPGVDIPVPADYDGDGKTDLAIFTPSTGQWIVLGSKLGAEVFNLGTSGDEPVPADYDGDGKADVGVYRPSTGQWIIQRSTAGAEVVTFGDATDVPVPADYDGDGKADLALYRPGTGQWLIQRSTAGAEVVSFGAAGDIPVPEDYDGDGKADLALFRPSSAQWIIIQSTAGARIQTAGNVNDIPVPAPYIDRAGSLGLRSVSADLIVGSTGLDLGSSASAFSASPTVGSATLSTTPSATAAASATTTRAPAGRPSRAQARAEHARELAEARQARRAEAVSDRHDRALEAVLAGGLGRRRPIA